MAVHDIQTPLGITAVSVVRVAYFLFLVSIVLARTGSRTGICIPARPRMKRYLMTSTTNRFCSRLSCGCFDLEVVQGESMCEK